MDANALKCEIKRNGLTLRQAAKKIGISETTMTRKLKNGTFGLDEAEMLVALLGIKQPVKVFFPEWWKKQTAAALARNDRTGEMQPISEAEYDIMMLKGLLHYHERITYPVVFSWKPEECKPMDKYECPAMLALDHYRRALIEAIRCIETVHGLSDHDTQS